MTKTTDTTPVRTGYAPVNGLNREVADDVVPQHGFDCRAVG